MMRLRTVLLTIAMLAAACGTSTTIEQTSDSLELNEGTGTTPTTASDSTLDDETAVDDASTPTSTDPEPTTTEVFETTLPTDPSDSEADDAPDSLDDPLEDLPVGCFTEGDFHGVDVLWNGLEGAVTAAVIADGQELVGGFPGETGGFLAAGVFEPTVFELRITTANGDEIVPCGTSTPLAEIPPINCSVEIVDGFPKLDVPYSGANVTVFRNGGAVLDWRVFDISAEPGETYTYTALAEDPRGLLASVEATCGTVTVPSQGEGLAPAITVARQKFRQSAFGPHAYLTLTVIPGVVPQHLYMAPNPIFDESESHLFEPPAPELVGPFRAHDVVLAALEEGRDVEVTIDPATGALLTWTIDGRGEELTCLELDTAFPDIRVDDGCVPTQDLLGDELLGG